MTARKHRPKSFRDLDTLLEFLAIAVEGKLITDEEMKEIGTAGGNILMEQGGVTRTDPRNPSHVGLVRHAVHVMREKFLELHPEHKPELEAWFDHGHKL